MLISIIPQNVRKFLDYKLVGRHTPNLTLFLDQWLVSYLQHMHKQSQITEEQEVCSSAVMFAEKYPPTLSKLSLTSQTLTRGGESLASETIPNWD